MGQFLPKQAWRSLHFLAAVPLLIPQLYRTQLTKSRGRLHASLDITKRSRRACRLRVFESHISANSILRFDPEVGGKTQIGHQ